MSEKNKHKPEHEDETFFVGSGSAASATDCTGLIQTLAQSEDEMDSYADIYNIPLQDKKYPYK